MNKKLHILFISSWFPSNNNLFSGDFVQRHAKAVSLINKVTVIHPEGVKGLKKTKLEVNEITENYQEYIIYFPKSKFKLFNFFRKIKAYESTSKKIGKYDLIHANVIYYNLIWVWLEKIFRGTKYVITEHSTIYHQKLSFTNRFIYGLISQQASVIMPVSKNLENAMQKNGIRGNYLKKTIPNVVNVKLFESKTIQSKDKCIFLHISMLLDSHKNISGQLMAAKILAEKGYDFEYHIGGNGDNQIILDFISNNNAQNYIKTFGALSHKEVAEKMQQADAFILFSNKENQPCVIIESFAVGTPVIASNVGGISEFFPETFGEVIKARDTNSLVKKMENILNGKAYASPIEMHKYAQNTFAEEVISQEFNTVYKTITT